LQKGQFAGQQNLNSSKRKRIDTGRVCRLGNVSLPYGILAQRRMGSRRLLSQIRSTIHNGIKELLRAFNDHAVNCLMVGLPREPAASAESIIIHFFLNP
jgi:hypothetical protein